MNPILMTPSLAARAHGRCARIRSFSRGQGGVTPLRRRWGSGRPSRPRPRVLPRPVTASGAGLP